MALVPTCLGGLFYLLPLWGFCTQSGLERLKMPRTGCAEGLCPSAGGAGVSPDFLFFTPFLARKGVRGMVESDVNRTA